MGLISYLKRHKFIDKDRVEEKLREIDKANIAQYCNVQTVVDFSTLGTWTTTQSYDEANRLVVIMENRYNILRHDLECCLKENKKLRDALFELEWILAH